MKIKRALTDFSEDLSNLQIGYAIILGVILCLLFCQFQIGEDQNSMSQYKSFLQSHDNFKYMCKLYKISELKLKLSQYKSFLQSHDNFKYMCKLYKDMLEMHNEDIWSPSLWILMQKYIKSIKVSC